MSVPRASEKYDRSNEDQFRAQIWRELLLLRQQSAQAWSQDSAGNVTFPADVVVTGDLTAGVVTATDHFVGPTDAGYVNPGTFGSLATPGGDYVFPANLIVTDVLTLGTTVAGAPTWSSGQAITLTTASQPNVTTMANLTTIGTLVAGAVPASLVTAGTFGAGDYVFPSDLTFTESLFSSSALATPSAFSATRFEAFASATEGAAIMGFGTTGDVALMNRAGTVVVRVGANTTSTSFAGNLVSTASNGILVTDTSDGSDTKTFSLGGGGAASNTRGGYVILSGNEQASTPGRVEISTGNASSGDMLLKVQGVTFGNVTRAAARNTLTWTGDSVWSSDNAFDIGASGATRPRTGYFGTSVVVGTDPGGSEAVRIGGALRAQVTSSGGSIVSNPGAGIDNTWMLSSQAGQLAQLIFGTNASNRWIVRRGNAAESGSDAGSQFEILARTDAGAAIDAPLSITRAAGGFIDIARDVSIARASGTASQLRIQSLHDTAANASQLQLRRARTGPAAVQSGDVLGYLTGLGYDSSAYVTGAEIRFVAAETFSGTARGSTIRFYTTLATTTTLTEQWRVTSSGVWQPGTDNANDIGLSGTRPRTVYGYTGDFATQMKSPIVDSGAATDLLLKRSGALLATGTALGMAWSVSTPTTLASDQNDYVLPAGNIVRLGNSAGVNITGFTAATVDGTWKHIVNLGPNPMTLKHMSASSSAANRIYNPGGADYLLGAGDSVWLFYDLTSTYWRTT